MAHDDVRAAVEWEAGGHVTDQLWTTLVKRGLVDEVVHGTRSVASLVAVVEELALTEGDISRGSTVREPCMVRSDTPLDEDDMERARLQALGRVIRIEAEQNHNVMVYRARDLKGELVPWDHIERWVASDRPSPTLWIELPFVREVPPHGVFHGFQTPISILNALGSAEGQQAAKAFVEDVGKMDSTEFWENPLRFHWLLYHIPQSPEVRRVATTHGSKLERLREVAALLAEIYPWSEAQAATFVVTGYEPVLIPIRAELRSYRHQSLSRMRLDVDPAVPPRALANRFAEERQPVVGQRHRDLSVKSLHLAIFMEESRGLTRAEATARHEIAAQAGKGTWEERMQRWNRQYPKWRYDDARRFTTDCTRAYRRLLGEGGL